MRLSRRRAARMHLVIVAATSAIGAPALAATGTWITNGSGNWSTTTAAGWNQASVPNGIDETATFSADLSADRTITNDVLGGITLGGITFNDPTPSNYWIIAGTNAITLDVTTGSASIASTGSNGRLDIGTLTINDNLSLSANASRTLVINSAIGDSGAGKALTINASAQAGTVVLGGANTFSGGVTLAAGALEARNAGTTNVLNSLGSSTLTLSGGTLNLRANGSASNQTINVASIAGVNNNLIVGANATISADRTGGSNTGSTFVLGNLSVGASTLTLNSSNSYALAFGATTLTGNATFTGSANATLATVGEDASPRNLTKSGTGLLAITGTDGHTGTTTISAGTLRVNSLGSGNLTIGTSSTQNAWGVLELAGGDFTRSLGTGAGQVQWTTTNGHGGFSAFEGDRQVILNNDVSFAPVWNTTAQFLKDNFELQLSSKTADSTTKFMNGIDLNGKLRSVMVLNGSADIDATLGGVLSNTSSNSGLIKGGLGTLRLDQTNTFGGGVLVQEGRLVASAINAVPNWVAVFAQNNDDLNSGHVAGVLQADVANAVGGAAYAGVSGTIKASNMDLNKVRILPGGALMYDNAAQLPAGTDRFLDSPSKGTVMAAGYAVDQSFVDRVATSYDGAIGLGADSSNNLDLTGLSNVRLGAWDPVSSVYAPSIKAVTYSGAITPSGDYKFGNGNAELVVSSALTGSRNVDVRSDDAITMAPSRGAGGAMQIPILPNRLTFTGNNDYTGTTKIGPYNIVKLAGAGVLSGTSDIQINGGQFNLAASSSSAINDSASLTVNNGGVLRYSVASGTEAMGALNLNSGELYVSGGGSGNLQFASINRSKGSSIEFASGGNFKLAADPTVLGAGNIIGGWATVANSSGMAQNFAAWDSVNKKIVSLATYNTGGEATWDANSNVNTASTTLTGNRNINTLRFSSASQTLTIPASTTLTVNAGGILAPGGSGTITGGTLTAGNVAGSNYELIFSSFSAGTAGLTVNSVIADNGANKVAVVKSSNSTYTNGDSNLQLKGINTYSGGTYLNRGRVEFDNSSSFGTGDVNFVGFSQVDVNNWSGFTRRASLSNVAASGTLSIANNLNLYADAALGSNSNIGSTYSGQVKFFDGTSLMIGTSGNTVFSGKITGDGNLIEQASGWSVTLGGGGSDAVSNDFTGKTYVVNTGGNTLWLNKAANVDAIPAGGLVIGGFQAAQVGTSSMAGKNVTLQNNEQINNAATIEFVGGVGNQGRLQMYGKNETIAGLVGLKDSGVVQNTGWDGVIAPATAATLTIGGPGKYEFGGTIRDGASSKLNLVKTGEGTQILFGTNTYTGNTTINDGALVVNGSLASPTVTIDGGTLGGSGTVSGTISIIGPATFAPGNSAGTLTLAGALPLAADSKLLFELSGADTTVGGGVNDLIAGVTDLTLEGTLDVTALASFASVSVGDRWTLIQYSGNLGGSGLTLGSMPALPAGGSFTIDTATPGRVDLVAVVPEPSALLLASGVALSSLAARRRRPA